MFCDYKISQVKDLGNRVEVIGYMSEGDYQDVLDPATNQIVNQYVRTNRIGQARILFEHNPVTDAEIAKEMYRALQDIKGARTIIPECIYVE